MQVSTHARYTMLRLEDNTFEQLDEFVNDEALARNTAKQLTAEARQTNAAEAKTTIVAVRTLESISRNTQATDLTIADIRWLAGEVVDRCDFYDAAPDWARNLIDQVPDRRNFDVKFVGRVLSAIRCILSVERQMTRQVERHEAAQEGK